MAPYLIISLLLVFLTLFDKTKLESVFYWMLVLILLIFSGFRVGGTGQADYYNYLFFYSLYTSFQDVLLGIGAVEIGFRMLSYIGNSLNLEGQFIIISMALLAFVPVVLLIKKYSFYPIASLVFLMPYFFTMNMHSSRTSAAAGLGLLAIHYFYQSKRILYILFFFLAMSFHTSAICLVFILLTKLNYRKLLFLLILSSVIGLILNPLFLIANIVDLIGLNQVANKILSYQGSEKFGYGMAIYDPRIILNIIICLLIYNIKSSTHSSLINFYYKTYFIGTICLVLFSSLTIVAWRVSYFFLISAVIVLPALSKHYNNRFFERIAAKRLMSTIMVFIYLMYFLPIIISALPYEFYFKI